MSSRSPEPAEPVEPVEPAELVEAAEPAELVEPLESVESAELAAAELVESAELTAAELPRRVVRDAQTARALAHPVRINIVEQLAFRGPLTATELSDLVGESPANTSWHLRQLARYGFIEEAGGGTGRQRPWRIILQSNDFGTGVTPDPETAEAARSTLGFMLEREVTNAKDWQRRAAGDPEWADASYLAFGLAWLTKDELHAVGRQLAAVLAPYQARLGDASQRPAGARPIRTVQWGIPADNLDDLSTT